MSIKTESITRILRIKGEIPEETSVWLQPAPEGKPFKCITCSRTLFHRQHRVLALIQDGGAYQLEKPPIKLQCVNCGHIYKINVF